MGGEDQLKGLIRQAFALQNAADRTVYDVDDVLKRVMLGVKQQIEALPEESLLRQKAWREIEPLIMTELEPYSKALHKSLEQQQLEAVPGMEQHALREAKQAGAKLAEGQVGPVMGKGTQQSVVSLINSARVNTTEVGKLFAAKDGVSPWTKSMFRVVDQTVRKGIIDGLTTPQIAELVVHETITKGVPGVSLQGETTARRIRSQAMAMSRTVAQDVDRQVHEAVWEDNADVLEGYEYQYTAALDSRTCEQCAPLDGQRYKTREKAPTTPLHVNCRCRLVVVDPTDEFWNNQRRNTQGLFEKEPKYKGIKVSQLKGELWREARNKGFYKSKIKVNGDLLLQRAESLRASMPIVSTCGTVNPRRGWSSWLKERDQVL